jgi:hypothetical protein
MARSIFHSGEAEAQLAFSSPASANGRTVMKKMLRLFRRRRDNKDQLLWRVLVERSPKPYFKAFLDD